MSRKVNEFFDLSDRVFIITGGAGLLGSKHAEAVLELGGIPILIDVSSQRLKAAEEELNGVYNKPLRIFEADITNENHLKGLQEKVFGEFGRIDGLVNNAALNPQVGTAGASPKFSRLENFPLEQWNSEIAVGVTGAFLCSKIFGAQMAASGRGVIVNVASDLGLIGPDQRIYRNEALPENEQPKKPITYSVVKGAMISMTRYLATYWADQGVRVNSICPGGVFTNQDPAFVKKLTNLIPLGRMAEKDEYKGALAFLLSDASSYMTGANLVVDGGRTSW